MSVRAWTRDEPGGGGGERSGRERVCALSPHRSSLDKVQIRTRRRVHAGAASVRVRVRVRVVGEHTRAPPPPNAPFVGSNEPALTLSPLCPLFTLFSSVDPFFSRRPTRDRERAPAPPACITTTAARRTLMAAAAAAWRASAAPAARQRAGATAAAAAAGGPSTTTSVFAAWRAGGHWAATARPLQPGRCIATLTRPVAAHASPVAEDAAYGADQIQVRELARRPRARALARCICLVASPGCGRGRASTRAACTSRSQRPSSGFL